MSVLGLIWRRLIIVRSAVSGALIGLAGAIGALGGVMVNLAFRQSFLTLKNGDGAYAAFVAFYVVCCLVTWVVFMRRRPGRLLGV
jgi:MFS transporter, NNP family, nitrate/nitrite transporter